MYTKPLHHFSITHIPTIYDEEALTVLELVARLSGKFNELIKDHNELVDTVNSLFGGAMAKAVDEWLTAHPEITTTLQDGEITLDKLHDTLKEKTVKDYVTPYMFGAVGDGVADDTEAIKQAMNNGTRIYFDGTFRVTDSLPLKNFMEVYGSKDSMIITDQDISIFCGSDEEVHGCYIHDLYLKNEHPWPTHYQMDLQNVNMGRIFRCRIDTVSTDYNSVGGIKVWKTLDRMYSPLIMACDLRNSSLLLCVTDGYVIGTNVWGQNRQFAVHITHGSWQISNCQFVGGKMGAVWVEDTLNGNKVDQVRINNCFFDGSYDNIQTGVGLRAKNMECSTVTGNTFWCQKEEGMILEDCGYCTVTGNVFDSNGLNNFKESSFNRSRPFYEIEIKGSAKFLNISNNSFRAVGEYHIPGGCINTNYAEGSITGNVITGNNASNYGFYLEPAFDIIPEFEHYGHIYGNTSRTQYTNVFTGDLKVTGRIEAGAGQQTTLTWGADDITGSNGYDANTGNKIKTYLIPEKMCVRKIACYLSTPITTEDGVISVVLRVNGVNNYGASVTFTADMNNPYVAYGEFEPGLVVIDAMKNVGFYVDTTDIPDAKNIQITAVLETYKEV